MARLGTRGRVLKWFTTALCLLTALAFFYSARRVLSWTSPSLQHDASLMVGAVYWGWRPATWQRETERYPGTPGWSIGGQYGSPPTLGWWIERSANRAWEWVAIPLWIPFVLFAMPAAVLWYRDRQAIRDTINRLTEWLSGGGQRRMTMRLFAACCAVHLVAVGFALIVGMWSYDFLFPHYALGSRSVTEYIGYAVGNALFVLLLSFPVWGYVWALLYVYFVNELVDRRHGPHCRECGYNLTGNISGRCPECGTAAAAVCPVETT